MVKEIHFSGYTAEPSDYECADGQLAESLNLISEDGQLKPLFPPSTIAQLSSDTTGVFIHRTAYYSHYILTCGQSLYYLHDNLTDKDEIHSFGCIIHKVSAIGNTLVIMADDGMHYILWRAKDGAYSYLGQKPPEICLAFSLSQNYPDSYDRDTIETADQAKKYYSAWRTTDIKATNACKISSDKKTITFKEKYQTSITQSIWALINETNAKITKNGHFYAPFFVRWCYRLYDGSMLMHSAPVFMPVSMPATFYIEVANAFSDGKTGLISKVINSFVVDEENNGTETSDETIDFGVSHLTFRYRPENVALGFSFQQWDKKEKELLEQWGDIIKSVDIFVSQPILRENTDEKIKTASIASVSWCKDKNLDTRDYPARLNGDENTVGNIVCDIPALSDDSYLSKIKNVSSFYKISSYKLEDLPSSISPVPVQVSKDVFPVLPTQEVMTDDYKSHNTLLPLFDEEGRCTTFLYGYNSRLNVSGIREKLFGGFSTFGLLPDTPAPYPNLMIYVKSIRVYLNTEEGQKIVEVVEALGGRTQYTSTIALENCPLFYPDNRAVKMVVGYTYLGKTDVDPNTVFYAEFPMKPCPLINGAFTEGGVMDSAEATFKETTKAPSETLTDDNSIVTIDSKIYTSEVNNPFVFPVTGINTIGTGTVLGIASANKALSQGQFGDFPLYAFTTDGVWALSVSDNGTYRAIQPFTRDVCTDPDSITQLDDAVLFASDRGIMLIAGSQSQCISDEIASQSPFNVLDLPCADQLHAKLGHKADACLPVRPFLDFLSGCRMVYDYVHQHIIVFNPASITGTTPLYTYAYVYSLKSKNWGMIYSDFAAPVNSYPDAMAITTDHRLVSFSTPDVTVSHGLYITRPLKLEAPDVHKTISALIQRGHFRRGDVGTVLYGSNDLYTWRLVWSSKDHYLRGFRGTPYKYFRIAGLTSLTEGKSIFGASINMEARLTDNLR